MRGHIKKSNGKSICEVFSLLGVDKRQVSRWRNKSTSGSVSGRCRKNKVIAAAIKLFDLNMAEAEDLANKAGLTVTKTTEFIPAFDSVLKKYPHSYRTLCKESCVDERMLRHLRNGKFLRKESLLAILIAAEVNFEDIQIVMGSAGYVLSDSIPAEAVIKWMLLNNGGVIGFNLLQQINETLHTYDLPLLMTREYDR